MKPSDERTAGMAAHGGTLAATILSSGSLGFVCALVLYLVFRDRGPFVRQPRGERAQRPDHWRASPSCSGSSLPLTMHRSDRRVPPS
jgi:hypothetical protein